MDSYIKKANQKKSLLNFFGTSYIEECAPVFTTERTEQEVSFLENVLSLQRGAHILDLACGYGRHTIALARRGFNLTGQDINTFLLNQAKKTAKRSGLKIHWVQKDMRDIPFQAHFEAVINLFTAFGYTETETEDQEVMNAIARALRPNGKFILDTISREFFARKGHQKSWMELPDGSIVVNDNTFDCVSGRNLRRKIRIKKTGEREYSHLSVRLYTVPELCVILRNSGLILTEAYGNYDGSELNLHSKRYILVAQKKE